MAVLDPLAAALAALFGAAFVAAGLANLGALRDVAFTGVDAPGRVRPGLAEVVARVQPASGTVEAPLTGEPCVGYLLREETKAGDFRSLFGLRWRTTARDAELRSFFLADGSGRVLVHPAPDGEAWRGDRPDDWFTDLDIKADAHEEFDADAELPAPLAAHASDVPGPRRYTEWRLDPDEPLYVIGRARAPEEGDPGEPAAVFEHDGGTFVVSQTPQWRTALSRLVTGVALLVVGVALLYAAVDIAGLTAGADLLAALP